MISHTVPILGEYEKYLPAVQEMINAFEIT